MYMCYVAYVFVFRETFLNALCSCVSRDWARRRRYVRQQSFSSRTVLYQTRCVHTRDADTDVGVLLSPGCGGGARSPARSPTSTSIYTRSALTHSNLRHLLK